MNQTGRYEYHDEGKRGSHKYWEICYDPENDSFTCFWGRIGAHPQMKEHISGMEAFKKIDEKVSKGYQYKGEAVSALERKPEVSIQGTIALSGEGYKEIKSEQAAAAERVAKKRAERAEEREAADWFIDELEKLG